MNVTAFKIAKQFLGLEEVPGQKDNPFIVWCLSTCNLDTHDETPWCSAFINGVCFILGLPRTNSALARSWLNIGTNVKLEDAKVGFDVCVFKRGTSTWQGHVGFYVTMEEDNIIILAGNASNSVRLQTIHKDNLLGIRRLLEE